MFVRRILMTPKEFSSNREQAQFPAPKTFEWAKQSDAHYTPPSVVSFSYRHHRPLCWPSARSCMGFFLYNNITSPSPWQLTTSAKYANKSIDYEERRWEAIVLAAMVWWYLREFTFGHHFHHFHPIFGAGGTRLAHTNLWKSQVHFWLRAV